MPLSFMRRSFLIAGSVSLIGAGLFIDQTVSAAPMPGLVRPSALAHLGEKAPDFAVVSSKGRTVRLSDFKGKIVVLEWTNDACPVVQKAYTAKTVQKLQKKYTEAGVVWLTIISAAPGSEGYLSGDDAEQKTADRDAAPTATLIDSKSDVARVYDVKQTPDLYIIDGSGILSYTGALEDAKDGKPFLANALDELLASKPVSQNAPKAPGCPIKYAPIP